MRLQVILLIAAASASRVCAQSTDSIPDPAGSTGPDAPIVEAPSKGAKLPERSLDAYDAVDEGNRLLKSGDPGQALRLYEHAASLEPDAREIAFAEGLSYYHLGDYERARRRFEQASLGQADALADDALYSEGAAYHAEALGAVEEADLAVSRLEHAMQRYQSVLANNPEHEAARDANYKAAHAWRQIKEIMQQQQQDQQGDQENDQEQEQQDQQQEQQQQNDDEQQQSSQEQEPQQSDQPQDQEQQQDQQQQPADDPQQNQQNQEPEQQQDQEQQPQPSEQEDMSREQAERKLREMMQAQRKREKERKKQRVPIPVRPAEKDW